MKRKIKALLLVVTLSLACATTSLAYTPKLVAPKLPTIPNVTGSVSIPSGATEAVKKAGVEAVKNIKIDLSNIKLNF